MASICMAWNRQIVLPSSVSTATCILSMNIVFMIMYTLQASRVTRAAVRLKKMGLEVRSRPYSYADTPQLDLDSLVLYTTGLKMSVSNEPCMDAHYRLDPVNILIYMWIFAGCVLL